MAALQALDELRRCLLKRGCAADQGELRLAGTLSQVSKYLRDRNRSRVRKLLDGVAPDSLAYEGFQAVWEQGVKLSTSPAVFEVLGGDLDTPIDKWLSLHLHPQGELYVCLGEEYDVMDDEMWTALAAWPNLQFLEVWSGEVGHALTDAALRALATSDSLRGLCLSTNNEGGEPSDDVTAGGIASLGGCRFLTSLDLTTPYVLTDALLTTLVRSPFRPRCARHPSPPTPPQAESCTSLSELTLTHCENLTDMGMKTLAEGCQALTGLLLENFLGLGDHALAAIGQLPALKEMLLSNGGLVPHATDAGIMALAKSTSLRTIHLNRFEQISDKGIAQLVAGCPALDSFELDSCHGVGSSGIGALVGSSSITKLSLRSMKLTNDGFRAISTSGVLQAFW